VRANIHKLAFCVATSVSCAAFGQGIPVIDAASLAQTIAIVKGQVDEIAHLAQQVATAKSQLAAVTGGRGMASLADTSQVRQALPPGFMAAADSMRRLGAAGASKDAKAIYESVKRFGCDEQFPSNAELRRSCEASAYMTPTTIGLIQESAARAQERAAKLSSMVASIDTADAKAAMDLQNRISIESAMLANEKMLMDMALQNQQAQKELLAQQRREEGMKKVLAKTDPSSLLK
jgi:type IV secretion system protein VirB5